MQGFFGSVPFNVVWLALVGALGVLAAYGVFAHPGDFAGPMWTLIFLSPPLIGLLLLLAAARSLWLWRQRRAEEHWGQHAEEP